MQSLPPVTVLKPVHGMEPKLEENLESFFRQDYPDFEIIFGARSRDNEALVVVDKTSRQVSKCAHPGSDFRRAIVAQCQGFFAGQNDRLVGQRLSGHQR